MLDQFPNTHPRGITHPRKACHTTGESSSFVFRFDGGYNKNLTQQFQALFSTLQPDAIGFLADDLTRNPVRWVGTESGLPSYPIWSTGEYGQGGQVDLSSALLLFSLLAAFSLLQRVIVFRDNTDYAFLARAPLTR